MDTRRRLCIDLSADEAVLSLCENLRQMLTDVLGKPILLEAVFHVVVSFCLSDSEYSEKPKKATFFFPDEAREHFLKLPQKNKFKKTQS